MKLTIVFETLALGLPDEELIGNLYQLIRLQYPNHACAVFKSFPTISGTWPRNRQATWKVVYEERFFFLKPIVGVCIPDHLSGEWIRRNGDGGLANWRYDHTKFFRDEEAKIVVRLKKKLN